MSDRYGVGVGDAAGIRALRKIVKKAPVSGDSGPVFIFPRVFGTRSGLKVTDPEPLSYFEISVSYNVTPRLL